MALELKHVAVDELLGRPTKELKEIAAEADAIRAAVRAELLRQQDEARQALEDAGLVDEAPAAGATRKRGRRSNAAAKATANGHDDGEELADEDLAQA